MSLAQALARKERGAGCMRATSQAPSLWTTVSVQRLHGLKLCYSRCDRLKLEVLDVRPTYGSGVPKQTYLLRRFNVNVVAIR